MKPQGKHFQYCVDSRQANNSKSFSPLFKQLISAAQLRLNYLQILGELKTYGGKIFNATLMVRILEMWTPTLMRDCRGPLKISVSFSLKFLSTLLRTRIWEAKYYIIKECLSCLVPAP